MLAAGKKLILLWSWSAKGTSLCWGSFNLVVRSEDSLPQQTYKQLKADTSSLHLLPSHLSQSEPEQQAQLLCSAFLPGTLLKITGDNHCGFMPDARTKAITYAADHMGNVVLLQPVRYVHKKMKMLPTNHKYNHRHHCAKMDNLLT